MTLVIRSLQAKLKDDPRLGRVVKGGVSGILGRMVTVLVNAISLPITVRYLGPQRYGIWVTISTTVVMLAVMDLGITNSLTNLISLTYVDGDKKAARRYYATAFWMSSLISALLGLATYLVWPQMQWGEIFHVTDSKLIHEISLSCAIALAFFLFGLPLNLVNKVLSGFQQTQLTNYFNMLSGVLGLVAIVVVVALKGSLPELMLVYSISLLSGTILANLWVNFWDRRWISPLPNHIDRDSIRRLMSSGLGFFILQIAGLIVFNSDNIVIAHYLGAAEVTPYSVTWKMANYAIVLQAAFFPSLWPAYSEAYARQDYQWVRDTFWRMARVVVGTATFALIFFGCFGQFVIRWYAGSAAVPTQVLLWSICGWTMLSACMNLEACLLAAIDRIRVQGILSVIAALLNIVISIYLVKRIGSLGVILGTTLSYILILVGPQTWIVWRALYPASSGIGEKQHV